MLKVKRLIVPSLLLLAVAFSIAITYVRPAHAQAIGKVTEAWYQYLYVGPVGADANPTAILASGSFTGTLTGYAANPTGTVQYRIDGKLVTLSAVSAISATSNATSLTLTGIPAAAQPATAGTVPCFATDNALQVIASCNVTAASGTLTLAMGAGFSATGFTGTGTKGLPAGWTVSYLLN